MMLNEDKVIANWSEESGKKFEGKRNKKKSRVVCIQINPKSSVIIVTNSKWIMRKKKTVINTFDNCLSLVTSG